MDDENKMRVNGCPGRFYIKSHKKEELCKNRFKCFFYKMYKPIKDKPTFDNPFVHVADFRNCSRYEQSESIEKNILISIIYGVLYINDLACASIVDCQDMIKDKDKETKKIFGALDKRRKKYEREIFEIVSDKIGFLATFNDFMDDKVQIHVKKLRIALNYVFGKYNLNDKVFLSKIVLSNMIVESSVEFLKKSIDTCCKYGINAVNLRYYSLDDIQKVSKSLTDWCLRKVYGIDLNNEVEIVTSYRELISVLSNWDIIKEAINETINAGDRE